MSFSTNKSLAHSPCDTCFRAKQTREVFYQSLNKTKECFEMIHCDVWGPDRVQSSCGARYFLTIVDDFSRTVWTYLLLEKSEVQTVLQNFCAMAMKHLIRKSRQFAVTTAQSFCLARYFREKGIIHQTSCVATPQQNGRVERKHMHILNVARSLLFGGNMPIRFWGEAILTASHLINRTPSMVLKNVSLYELLYGEKPSYEHLKVFGSLCFVHAKSRDNDKFGSRSRRCVFVGYPFTQKGWKVFDLETEEFLISRDVIFKETEFPYSSQSSVPTNSQLTTQVHIDDDWEITNMSAIEDRGVQLLSAIHHYHLLNRHRLHKQRN